MAFKSANFEITDPATDERIASVADFDREVTAAAIERAAIAQRQMGAVPPQRVLTF